MKKFFLLLVSACLILLYSGYCFAQESYSNQDTNNAINEIQNNPALIDQTMEKIKNNPEMTQQMLTIFKIILLLCSSLMKFIKIQN